MSESESDDRGCDEGGRQEAAAKVIGVRHRESRHEVKEFGSFENPHSDLYNLGRNSLPDAVSNPSPAPKPRRWSILAAGLLLLALALVVIYTSHSAFLSPLALVVVAAIGLAALLLQLRLRNKDLSTPVRAPLWLNVLGVLFAITAVLADIFHVSANLLQVAALGAVICFGISGTTVLHALHKKKA